jgi:antitoxin MazE
MRVAIVNIGNSRGIRLPKALIEQFRLGDAVELEAHEDYLVIRPARVPRNGWDQEFTAMAEAGEDDLLDRESSPSTKWDEHEWEW